MQIEENPAIEETINKFLEENMTYSIPKGKKISLWIDPIDGTSQLIKGNYEPIASMVGISLDLVPLCGFIHQPLNLSTKKPTTVFNSPGKGVFFLSENIFTELHKKIPNQNYPFYFILSFSRTKNNVLNFIQNFPNAKIIKHHGAGFKVLYLLSRYDEPYFNGIYFKPDYQKIGYWDICASDAILKELGGGIFVTIIFY